ncbi:MAG: replicative DNA helicase [Candidatus Methylomirabilales bacterium]
MAVHPPKTVEKIPPQNVDAETAVLGAILLDRDALVKAFEVLRPDHFYREAHRKIFAACQELFERNEPVDLITLANELTRRHQLEEMGGSQYLVSLAEAVPTAANVVYHASIVRGKALLRELIGACTSIVSSCYEDTEPTETVLDVAEKKIFGVSKDRIRPSFRPIKSILKSTFEDIERLYSRKGHVTGVPTGFADLDDLTGGLQHSDLIVIAGRPSMGKTSFALGMAMHAAMEEGIPAAIFSLEMSMSHVVQRMLCAEARVEAYRLRTGRLGDKDWPKLTTAAGRLSEAPIHIDDTPSMNVLELRAKARRVKTEHGIGLMAIDYLQLLKAGGRFESRQQEMTEICRSLKALAKELEIPIVALSQLSRAVESRDNKRPQLADLRESGAIEQDADLVAFIYRPGYYKALQGPEEKENYEAEIIVAKQRNGPTGPVTLTFRREYMRFEDAELTRTPPFDLSPQLSS